MKTRMSQMGTVSAALVSAVSLAACESATDSTSSVVDSQTGSGSSCSGGSKHLWPIGMAANSLDCTEIVGAGVAKSFQVGTCEQDIPPTLYTTGIDTTCCTDPAAAGCVTGSLSALDGKATIYPNGKKCAP